MAVTCLGSMHAVWHLVTDGSLKHNSALLCYTLRSGTSLSSTVVGRASGSICALRLLPADFKHQNSRYTNGQRSVICHAVRGSRQEPHEPLQMLLGSCKLSVNLASRTTIIVGSHQAYVSEHELPWCGCSQHLSISLSVDAAVASLPVQSSPAA